MRLKTAIGQFSVRTLGAQQAASPDSGVLSGNRSGFHQPDAERTPGAGVSNPWREESMLLWAASIMMMVLAAVGTRVAFALPLDLRANWIFRVIGVRGGLETLDREPACAASALRRAGVARRRRRPVWDFGLGGRTRRTWWFLDSLGMIAGGYLHAAFSEDPVYLFLPARQIARSHGFSGRTWRASGWLGRRHCLNATRCARPAAWR